MGRGVDWKGELLSERSFIPQERWGANHCHRLWMLLRHYLDHMLSES